MYIPTERNRRITFNQFTLAAAIAALPRPRPRGRPRPHLVVLPRDVPLSVEAPVPAASCSIRCKMSGLSRVLKKLARSIDGDLTGVTGGPACDYEPCSPPPC